MSDRRSYWDDFGTGLARAEQALQTRPARRWLSAGWKRVSVFCIVGGLSLGGVATATVLGVRALTAHQSAYALFRTNPGGNLITRQHQGAPEVIQASVTRVATLNVPHVGKVQYWVALTRHGQGCEALRAPDRTWMGAVDPDGIPTNVWFQTAMQHKNKQFTLNPTPAEKQLGERILRDYNFAGWVPACSTHSINASGFDAKVDALGPSALLNQPLTETTMIFLGTAHLPGAVRVRDVATGQTAPILRHGFFVLQQSPGVRTIHDLTLTALDRSGRTVGSVQVDNPY